MISPCRHSRAVDDTQIIYVVFKIVEVLLTLIERSDETFGLRTTIVHTTNILQHTQEKRKKNRKRYICATNLFVLQSDFLTVDVALRPVLLRRLGIEPKYHAT